MVGFFGFLLLGSVGFVISENYPVVFATPPSGEIAPLVDEVKFKDVFFDSGKYDIRPDAEVVLKENVEVFNDLLKKVPDAILVIEGYSDIRGADTYNLELARKRASEVKKYLVILGISRDRIETVAKGETDKFAEGITDEAFSLNRRVHISLRLPEQSIVNLPPLSATGKENYSENLPSASDLKDFIGVELKRFAPKYITFTVPLEMKVGVFSSVETMVAKDIVGTIQDKLKSYKEATVKLNPSIGAYLKGNNYYIEALTQEEQEVGNRDDTTWKWRVMPLKAGNQSLILSVALNFNIGGFGDKQTVEYPLYVRTVTVGVNPLYSVKSFIRGYWKVLVILMIGFGVVGFSIKKRRANL